MSGIYLEDEIPERFWKILQDAKQDPRGLDGVLENLDRTTIEKLAWNYEAAVTALKSIPPAKEDLSEDVLDELCNWIVAQGKDYFMEVWDSPELAIDEKLDPGILSAILQHYEDRFGARLPRNETADFIKM